MSRYRLAYVSGPIEAAKVYQEWRTQKAPDYFGTIYLTQLYHLLDKFSIDGLIITTLQDKRPKDQIDHVTIVNIPLPKRDISGAIYHLAMLIWAVRCTIEIAKFRANVALLTAGQDYFWVFRSLRLCGTRLLASLHCTLWPKYARRPLHKRMLCWLNGHLFYPACDFVQGVSEEAVRQICAVSPRLQGQPVRFLATYERARFASILPPVWPGPNDRFRLLYVGRLEVNKGVLDLVAIMRLLEQHEPGRYHLEICGEGGAELELRRSIVDSRLEGVIQVNGQCKTQDLARKYTDCHVVVVPTRSDFEEGTPKVAFEAVLNLRPVVMSAACPALADVMDATVEPRVDDVGDYVRAIRCLAENSELYGVKVAAANQCREKHFDIRNSYGSVLERGLRGVLSD